MTDPQIVEVPAFDDDDIDVDELVGEEIEDPYGIDPDGFEVVDG
jgi:hypothetical protein